MRPKVMQEILKGGMEVTEGMLLTASKHSNLSLLSLLLPRCPKWSPRKVIDTAVDNVRVSCMMVAVYLESLGVAVRLHGPPNKSSSYDIPLTMEVRWASDMQVE